MSVHLREQIAKAALLGLERGRPELPAASGALAAAMAGICSSEVEARWLDAAALASMHAHAGRLPPTGKPLVAPCPAETRPLCGRGARNYLSTMLSGRFEVALPGWIADLDAAGLRVPEIHVPGLLSLACKNRQTAAAARRCCGEVGRWLALQHPEWRALEAAEGDDAWNDGNINERASWLKARRARDPAAGLRALQEVWAGEGSREKATLLNCLKIGLSIADEELLEAALDDKRKEVRQPAAKLLGMLAESRLVQRMRERLKPLLQVDKRGKLAVTLPTALDKAAERDGIESSSHVKGLGDKASWLMQMVACIPPAEWYASGAAPAAILKSADKTEWAYALRLGWSIAAGIHGDARWVTALLEKPVSFSGFDVVGKMLQCLSQPERESALVKLGEFEHINLYTWADHVPAAWSESFTLAAAKLLQSELKTWDRVRWSLNSLPRMGACMNAGALEKVARLLDPAGFNVPEAAAAAHELLDLLRFRREAHDAIKEKP